ncbi:hypothetical protein [[Mycoplasma] imitans]|uniref:hypothetical protein n=1 Tax=[Mycoplasma] imitans TaxID=29560 RepID=UPI0006856493|nr:hypothetical protein [[Mycoplasma] imitans]
MTPYQKEMFEYDDNSFVDPLFQNGKDNPFDDGEQNDFGFDTRTNRIKKNINYDEHDLKTLDLNRNKNKHFEKLVQSTKTYNFIAIWLNLVFLITFVLAIVFFYLNKFSFQRSESTYVSVNLFLTIIFTIISYLISIILYSFVKMHNKSLKGILTEKTLSYYSLFKKAYVSYFLIGWIPMLGLFIGVGLHISLQNLDESDVKDNNLWYQESISDLLIDIDGYENSYRELESKKLLFDQELQRLNYEKQLLNARKNEIAIIQSPSRLPNFRNSKQLVNYVENSSLLSASLVEQVKSAITQLREERRKLRRENRRLRALLARANKIEEQPLMLTSSSNLFTERVDDDFIKLSTKQRKNELLALDKLNDRIDWLTEEEDRSSRAIIQIGQTKKESAHKTKSNAPVIVKRNNKPEFKINLISSKKDHDSESQHKDKELTKQNDLLNFVNSMYSSQSTLSFDNLFNEADDTTEADDKSESSDKPRTIKVKLSIQKKVN